MEREKERVCGRESEREKHAVLPPNRAPEIKLRKQESSVDEKRNPATHRATQRLCKITHARIIHNPYGSQYRIDIGGLLRIR